MGTSLTKGKGTGNKGTNQNGNGIDENEATATADSDGTNNNSGHRRRLNNGTGTSSAAGPVSMAVDQLTKTLHKRCSTQLGINGITSEVFANSVFPQHEELGQRLFHYFHVCAGAKLPHLTQLEFREQCERFLSANVIHDKDIVELILKLFCGDDQFLIIKPMELFAILKQCFKLVISHSNVGITTCILSTRTFEAIVSSCFVVNRLNGAAVGTGNGAAGGNDGRSLSSEPPPVNELPIAVVHRWLTEQNGFGLLVPLYRFAAWMINIGHRRINQPNEPIIDTGNILSGLQLKLPILKNAKPFEDNHLPALPISAVWLLAGCLPDIYSKPQLVQKQQQQQQQHQQNGGGGGGNSSQQNENVQITSLASLTGGTGKSQMAGSSTTTNNGQQPLDRQYPASSAFGAVAAAAAAAAAASSSGGHSPGTTGSGSGSPTSPTTPQSPTKNLSYLTRAKSNAGQRSTAATTGAGGHPTIQPSTFAPAFWTLLYASREDGLGVNRFLHHVLGYRGPTICLFKASHNQTFCVASSQEWRESTMYQGDQDCCLFKMLPTFSLIARGPKMIYLNTIQRGHPKGLRIALEYAKPLLVIDESFDAIAFHGVVYDLNAIEVWGCGDPRSRAVQLDIQRWQVQEAERNRTVKLTAAEWAENPDRYLLELGGRTQYNTNNN